MQDSLPIENDFELQQRAEKPKIRIPHNGEPQSAIGASIAKMRKEVAKNVDAILLNWVRRRYARDERSRQQSHERTRQKEICAVYLMTGKLSRKTRADDRSRDDCEKCAQLDDAVAPGKLRIGQKFRQQTVF